MELPKHDDGIIVEDYISKETWTIGSSSVVVSDMVFTQGNFSEVFKRIQRILILS